MANEMKDRIRLIMESQHMTQQVFADFIGSTPATLSGIFNDRTRPTLNIVEAIKKKIPDISTDWLMFGSGEMYQQGASPQSEAAPPERQRSTGHQVQEPLIDFGTATPPTPPQHTQQASPAQGVYNGVRTTPTIIAREEVKYIDKPKRHVTEIRVYYDDQTWESFVPSKK